MSSEPVTRYWWCRNGMVDDESGDGMLRLKAIPPESFIPTTDYDRDIKALGERLTTLRQEQLAEQRKIIAEQAKTIERLQGVIDCSVYRIMIDGNQYCAVDRGFENLQVSKAGFGDTASKALAALKEARDHG